MQVSSMPNAAAAYSSRQAPQENAADQIARRELDEAVKPDAKKEAAPPAETSEARSKPKGMGEKLDVVV